MFEPEEDGFSFRLRVGLRGLLARGLHVDVVLRDRASGQERTLRAQVLGPARQAGWHQILAVTSAGHLAGPVPARWDAWVRLAATPAWPDTPGTVPAPSPPTPPAPCPPPREGRVAVDDAEAAPALGSPLMHSGYVVRPYRTDRGNLSLRVKAVAVGRPGRRWAPRQVTSGAGGGAGPLGVLPWPDVRASDRPSRPQGPRRRGGWTRRSPCRSGRPGSAGGRGWAPTPCRTGPGSASR